MPPLTFEQAEYAARQKLTGMDRFLRQVDDLIPWQKIERRIAPYYRKAGLGPYPLSAMLRVYCLQIFYSLDDADAAEDALCEFTPMRLFAGLSLSGPMPQAGDVANFRRLLARHGLGRMLVKEIDKQARRKGIKLRPGKIAPPRIVSAPAVETDAATDSGKG